MRLEVLTESERALVHDSALRILEEVGLHVPSASLVERLRALGLQVSPDSRLFLPRANVEEALARAPRCVRLGARGSGRQVRLDGSRTFVCTDGCGSKALDLETGARRPSTLQDVARSARLADALDEFHVYWMMVSAQDAPRERRVALEYLTALQNTGKHVQMVDVAGAAEADILIGMARLLQETGLIEGPPVSILISVVTPLRLDPGGTEAALACAAAGLPVVACSMPIASVTSPATASGTVALAHAEAIGLIAILELSCPGAPAIYCSFPAFADARTGATNYGDPRKGWAAAAAAQMGRSLGVPCFTSGDPLALMAAPDLMSGGGLLETSTLLACEQLVIDDEALRYARLYAAGCPVDPESLALEAIRQVGPGGHFLAHRHTARHVREFFVARFTEPEGGGTPQAGPEGAGTPCERARREARRLLATHAVEPLPREVGAALERLARDGDGASPGAWKSRLALGEPGA